jgi:hypothetical protein
VPSPDRSEEMVAFEDRGAIIDAPIARVWDYLNSVDHGAAHAGNARHFEVRETVGPTSLIAAERKLRGTWSVFVSRSSDFPPLCIVNEEVEGDFAGTRFVVVYTPEGNVTRVDVYGDIQSKVFPPSEAKRIFLDLLQGAYEEDLRAIRRAASTPESPGTGSRARETLDRGPTTRRRTGTS